MKIVIAPDSFKESLTSIEAAEAIREGLFSVWPDAKYTLVPMADGGEGTVQAVADALGEEVRELEVTGPLGLLTAARFAVFLTRKTAVIEMAEASGLMLAAPEERNPMVASTYGTGELIVEALDLGCREIMLGLGGSATVDGGIGALVAMGLRLLDSSGCELKPSGAALSSIAEVDATGLDPRLKDTHFSFACDVTSPLLGRSGAAMLYGAQKGATRVQQDELEAGMVNWSKFLPFEVLATPGSGAAGGLAAGLLAFLEGEMLSGVDYVASLVGLDAALEGADLVITGEGAINHQTIHGKTPIGVAARSHAPVVAFAGLLEEGYEEVYDHGITACWPINDSPCTTEEALRNAALNLRNAAERFARTITIGQKL